MKPLQATACLLMLLQAFHLASLQTTTDSPGRTIDKSWYRKPVIQALDNTEIPLMNESDFRTDASDFASEHSGLASGSMAGSTEEEENVITLKKNENETTEPNISNKLMPFVNGTIENPEVPDAAVSPANATTDSTNSTKTNMSEGEEGFNSTRTTEKPTSPPGSSDTPVLPSTTVAPENQTTQHSTTAADADKGLANRTGSIDKHATTTSAPETNKTSVGYLPTMVVPFKTTNTTLITTTAAPNTPERANKTGGGIFSGRDNLGESGMDSDPYRRKRNVAWVAILGTAAAAACVGVVAYLVLKKKHQKGFTHRKLVEEFPSDPVLRLDNCEPLDLKFGGSGSAYYNPGLQGDNIQMADIPGRR
nr:mucin-15 isoform X1 [Nothobranchius furzeri]